MMKEEDTNVYRLLDQIAAQSHFEDRYELRGVIAKGGMGQVHRAYDRILRREVAIKMMRDGLGITSDATAIRGQFLKEARVGGRLLHPNILSVFDVGVNHSGQIYYTMRLVDGASLHDCLDALDKGVVTKLISYPLRKVIEALVGVCQGLDFAHQNSVIHLDLKPNNVLVSGFNEVFVIDWGLAKIDEIVDLDDLVGLYKAKSNSSDTASRTGAFDGRIVGTPGYMAPEQARGDYRYFDPTTDVYGLGGILYFILYGRAPNEGSTLEILASLVSSPAAKRKGKLRQGILPRGQRVRKESLGAIEILETMALKALEPDQAKRYETVEQMITELTEWLASVPSPTGWHW